MKKTILYLSITSLLTIPNAIATEVASRANAMSTDIYPLVELLQIFRAKNESLWDQIKAGDVTIAMEASLEKGEREKLKRDLAHMAQEVGKEKASKEAAQRLVEIMKHEQREAKDLLNHVLEKLIPPYTLPIEDLQTPPSFPLEMTKQVDLDDEETPKKEIKAREARAVKEITTPKEAEIRKENKSLQGMGAPSLSTHQQKLLFQRHLIGNTAWAALDGKNARLSATLCEMIQRHQGKTVEIYCLKSKNFTLLLNGKVQDYPYKF